MPSQKMRLEAEMKDNASPAVRKLRQELADLQATSAETRGVAKLNAEIAKLTTETKADASPAVRKLRTELAELQKSTAENRAVQTLTKEIASLKKMSGEVQATAGMKAFGSWFGEAKTAASGVMGVVGGLPGVLGAIGIGGIAAGASVEALASEMKRLGEAALDLKELSRQTGISIDFVNRWSHAGEHFAVGTDAMKGALDGFASQLPDFDRGIGGLFKEFSIWPDLVRKMRSESPADALMDALRQAEEVGRTKGPEVQKQILESIFPGHGAEMERLFGDGGLKGLLEQLHKPWAGPSQDLLGAAKQLRDARIGLLNDFERLENDVAPGFIKVLSKGVGAVDLLIKAWIWEFDRIADVFGYLGKKAQQEDDAAHAAPNRWEKAAHGLWHKSSYEDDSRGDSDAGGRGLPHKTSYTDGDDFRRLLKNASYTAGVGGDFKTAGGTGSGTMEGAIADGSKAGVLAALREMAIEKGLKGDGGSDETGGSAGGAGGPGGGSGGSGGGGSSEGGGSGGGNAGGAEPYGRRALMTREHRRTASGGYGGKDAPELSGDATQRATSLIKAKEGFQSKAYWDVNHWRLGYGSDTMTDAQGKVHEVQQGDATDRAGADRDLGRRVKEFAARAATQVGVEHWKKLSQNAQAALTSMAYNYGGFSKLKNVRDAIATEDPHRIADAIRARSNDNRGVNAKRRMQEADLVERGDQAQTSAVADPKDDLSAARVSARMKTLHTLNEQCVSLARAAVNSAKTVHEWRPGESAQDGTLKPGTPLATFLDRQGKQSDRYAGGGNGTPGAGLDHAGVFEKYIRDKGGKIVGMTMAEQYQGSRGVHDKDYMFGSGRGEHNASNYRAIKEADGSYLGGDKNPMNRRADSPAVAAAPQPQPQRRADADLSGARRPAREESSEHLLKIDLRDPSGQVKSTHLQSRGPMRVEMRNRWKTGQSPLIQA